MEHSWVATTSAVNSVCIAGLGVNQGLASMRTTNEQIDKPMPLEQLIEQLDGWLVNLILSELVDEPSLDDEAMLEDFHKYQRALKTKFGIETAKGGEAEEIAKTALLLLAESPENAAQIAALIHDQQRLLNKGFILDTAVIVLAIKVLQTRVEVKWDANGKSSVHSTTAAMDSKNILKLVEKLVGFRDL